MRAVLLASAIAGVALTGCWNTGRDRSSAPAPRAEQIPDWPKLGMGPVDEHRGRPPRLPEPERTHTPAVGRPREPGEPDSGR